MAYCDDMASLYAAANLVVCRAGATTLAEITARGLPAILVPYPYAAENHQEHNARAVMAAGASRMILNKDLDAESLLKVLHELLDHPDELEKMAVASRALGKPEAAGEIADMAIGIAK
ncbi:MAG: undecaprenyldiphospho-muramoylpentapeptide beta-N-acetylglucosaminyltransferase, partial [Selenomonadaceae bacterium]|nr:undecaprenyldiphospho-muramoylpentapeptide beta-N-acetylglucosaminyltransferase [Selenomonadaceae bacterium]